MRMIRLIVLCAFLLFGQALAEEQQTATKDTLGQKERMSYSLGFKAGSNMKNRSVDLDPDIFIKAFREGFSGNKAAMTDQEMNDTLRALQKELKAKQAENKKESAERTKKLSEKNKNEGEVFLTENANKEGVVILPSGLQYKVLAEGSGKTPDKTANVTVHYRGTIVGGAEFGSSYKKGKPQTVRLESVIPGWFEALLLMKEGAKWQLFVPPKLAYGEKGLPARGKGKPARIPPNAALIFDIELISIN